MCFAREERYALLFAATHKSLTLGIPLIGVLFPGQARCLLLRGFVFAGCGVFLSCLSFLCVYGVLVYAACRVCVCECVCVFVWKSKRKGKGKCVCRCVSVLFID